MLDRYSNILYYITEEKRCAMDTGIIIKRLRERAGLSQQELSKKVGIPRPALAQVENGKRKICSKELKKFSEIFEVSADYLLGEAEDTSVILEKGEKFVKAQDIRISVPQIKKNKFKQVILYLLERCAGKPNVGQTVLYKLLYFADFNFYELYEEQMTGATYRKQKFGPVPLEFNEIIKDMEKKGEIKEIRDKYYEYPQKRYLPLVKADLNQLKASEKDVLDKVIDQLSDTCAADISAFSHEDMPWKATKDKEIMAYELVFYRTMPYSVRTYKDDEKK
jgi:transcriptional regulator with XRE-family HTH domain